MNKEELIQIIKKSGLQDSIVITSGGALVLYGLKKETNDIDVECTDMQLKKELLEDGFESNPAVLGGMCIQYKALDIHFVNEIIGKVNIVDNIQCLDLYDIMEQYKSLMNLYEAHSDKYKLKYEMLKEYLDK